MKASLFNCHLKSFKNISVSHFSNQPSDLNVHYPIGHSLVPVIAQSDDKTESILILGGLNLNNPFNSNM